MITEKEFASLFDYYVDDVSAFLSTYTSNRAQLKDWVQEVFIKLWRKRDRIDFDHPAFRSYLLKTARNNALKDLKRGKKYDLWLEEKLENLTQLHSNNKTAANFDRVHEAYSMALSKISQRSRRAYQLSREEGLTYSEIAEVMDISIKTVETHISKALRILREELSEFE